MAIPTAIKQIACERLFHFHPVKIIAHYPIGHTELARRHGVRPSSVYREIQAYLEQSPSAKLPLRLQAWKLVGQGASEEHMTDRPERIHYMVDKCFESAKNEQELKRNIKEMFISYESLFEEVMVDCKDDLKKKNCSNISISSKRCSHPAS